MGGPLLRKDLDSAIETLSLKAREGENERFGEREANRLVSEEFNTAKVRFVFLKKKKEIQSFTCLI